MEVNALYRNCIFESREYTETHKRVAQELSDHHLVWKGKNIDTRLYKFAADQLSIYSLRYGEEVEIVPDVYNGFSLIHFSHKGGISIDSDNNRYDVRQSNAIISTPRKKIRLNYSRACEQLILRVPHQEFQKTCTSIERPHLFPALVRNSGTLINGQSSLHLQYYLQTFMTLESYAKDSDEYLPWLRHTEKSIIMFLLLQSAEARDKLNSGPHTAEQRLTDKKRHERIERLHEYASRNLTQPLTLHALASHTALSERQLNLLCHEQFGVSPMVWLRNLRLNAIRSILLGNPSTHLSSVPTLYGFSHLGRFSQYYKAYFGELPSETLKKAING